MDTDGSESAWYPISFERWGLFWLLICRWGARRESFAAEVLPWALVRNCSLRTLWRLFLRKWASAVETENISGLKECHYFCCKNVQGSLASPSDICSSLSCANANSSSQKRWNIPLHSQTHLSSGLFCSCQQLSHLGLVTEPSPRATHFCCWQLHTKSCWAWLRCSFPMALHISFLSSSCVGQTSRETLCLNVNSCQWWFLSWESGFSFTMEN